MVHVSKNRLSAAQLEALGAQLTRLIGALDADQSAGFLYELLGKEEKEVLAKRLAAITLIHEQYSSYAIAQRLHMSQSTVGILVDRYHEGDFDTVVSLIHNNKKRYLDYLKIIEAITTVGGIMPAYGVPRMRRTQR